MLRQSAHAEGSRTPYRGIRRQNQCYLRLLANSAHARIKPITGLQRRLSDASAVLLPVVSEHLIAGSADLGAMLLKAAENTEVALIYHCTAMALHIAGTGLLLVRRAA